MADAINGVTEDVAVNTEPVAEVADAISEPVAEVFDIVAAEPVNCDATVEAYLDSIYAL